MVDIKNKSMTYQLGYNMGRYPPTSINYQKRLHIPINSFSNPKIQSKQYVAGWKAGRQALRRKLKQQHSKNTCH